MVEKSRESCLVCQIVANRIPSYKVYEDEFALVALDINGAVAGHCFVMPKNHYPILEQVPDEELAHLFVVANKISSAIFENLKVQGTNIFVTNGIPAGQIVAHFVINVIPRKENDGINLQWKPKQLTEEEMSTVELKLRENMQNVGVEKLAKQENPKMRVKKPVGYEGLGFDEEEEHFMKQTRRIP